MTQMNNIIGFTFRIFFFFFQNSPDFKELKNSKCDDITAACACLREPECYCVLVWTGFHKLPWPQAILLGKMIQTGFN